jgi:Trk K+ transport system NAD-binding subunit
MGVLRDDCGLVGKTIADFYQSFDQYDFEIVAVWRREHVLLPHLKTLLQAGDRLLLIASSAAREALSECISPLPESQESAAQPSLPDAHPNV